MTAWRLLLTYSDAVDNPYPWSMASLIKYGFHSSLSWAMWQTWALEGPRNKVIRTNCWLCDQSVEPRIFDGSLPLTSEVFFRVDRGLSKEKVGVGTQKSTWSYKLLCPIFLFWTSLPFCPRCLHSINRFSNSRNSLPFWNVILLQDQCRWSVISLHLSLT